MTVESKKDGIVKSNLKEILNNKGIKQKTLADDLQISKQNVSNLCTGRFSPGLEQALRIAKYLDTPLEEIFYLEDI